MPRPGGIVLLWRTNGAIDLFLHYDRNEGVFDTGLDPAQKFGLASRLAAYARVYASCDGYLLHGGTMRFMRA